MGGVARKGLSEQITNFEVEPREFGPLEFRPGDARPRPVARNPFERALPESAPRPASSDPLVAPVAPTAPQGGVRGGRRQPLLPPERRDELLQRAARGESDFALALAFGIAVHQVAKLRYNNAGKIRKLRQLVAGAAPAPEETGEDPPPIECALNLLAERVERLRGGFFRLDGRPAGLQHIMATANEVRLERGEPVIPYPGVARPRRR